MPLIGNEIPRNLPERTGIHICVVCLREVRPEEFYGNDHACATCAEKASHFPLASTPEAADDAEPESAQGVRSREVPPG